MVVEGEPGIDAVGGDVLLDPLQVRAPVGALVPGEEEHEAVALTDPGAGVEEGAVHGSVRRSAGGAWGGGAGSVRVAIDGHAPGAFLGVGGVNGKRGRE